MFEKSSASFCRAAIQDQFGSVHVINLSSRQDRRREMAAELRKVGLSFADGTALLLDASRFSEPAGFPTVGTRGCFDSHLRALRSARDLGGNGVLVLEDDCDFRTDIARSLPKALDALSEKQWAFFYGGFLEHPTAEPVHDQSPIFKANPQIGVLGAHFIAVSSRALDPLIAYLEQMVSRDPGSPLGGPMHVDGAYSWFRRDNPDLETWIANPQLGFQRPSRTDIHELRLFDRVPIVKQLAKVARIFKRALR